MEYEFLYYYDLILNLFLEIDYAHYLTFFLESIILLFKYILNLIIILKLI